MITTIESVLNCADASSLDIESCGVFDIEFTMPIDAVPENYDD